MPRLIARLDADDRKATSPVPSALLPGPTPPCRLVMKESKGRVNPQLMQQILLKMLKGE